MNTLNEMLDYFFADGPLVDPVWDQRREERTGSAAIPAGIAVVLLLVLLIIVIFYPYDYGLDKDFGAGGGGL